MNIKSIEKLIIRSLAILLFGLVLMSCSDTFNSEIEQDTVKNEAQNLNDNAVGVEQVIIPEIVVEPTPEKVIEKPKIEVTIKDFKLGMATDEIKSVINKVGLKYDNYGVHLQNACSSNTANPKVKPMIEGGMSSIEPHFYDQACQLAQYDLLGSTSEVNMVLHDDGLVWIHFYTTGSKLAGSNQTLVGALINKYGEPEKYKYRDLFGLETGFKWEINDNRILLKSSSLTLESIKGREEFVRRDKALKSEKGSVL